MPSAIDLQKAFDTKNFLTSSWRFFFVNKVSHSWITILINLSIYFPYLVKGQIQLIQLLTFWKNA